VPRFLRKEERGDGKASSLTGKEREHPVVVEEKEGKKKEKNKTEDSKIEKEREGNYDDLASGERKREAIFTLEQS